MPREKWGKRRCYLQLSLLYYVISHMMTDDKIKLLETDDGEEIRRYGMLIGYAVHYIAQGC